MAAESPKNSFDGWDLYEFVKGRKKMLVTLVGAAIGYLLTDQAAAAAIGAAVVEMGFSIAEFYFKRVKLA